MKRMGGSSGIFSFLNLNKYFGFLQVKFLVMIQKLVIMISMKRNL